jgi:hypothetical protein
MTKPLSILFALAASLALLALPAVASAEYFIPDNNSAVNQYTEGIPTGGGEKSAKGAGEKEVRPAQTIGAKNTKKLEQEGGQEGREVAEVAAETAPPEVVIADETEPADAGNKDQPAAKGDGKKNAGKAPNGQGDSTNTEDNEVVTPVATGDGPSGSGGFGEILAAATGGSDGGIGLLLPLVIVAAIAWGVGYAWRKREHEQTAGTTQP